MAEWEENGERLFLLPFSCFQTPHGQCDPYKTELSADVTFDKASPPFFFEGGGGAWVAVGGHAKRKRSFSSSPLKEKSRRTA